MTKTILNVDGMSCSHCENAVKKAVSELGVIKADVDLSAKTVTIEYDENSITLKNIKDAIEEQGYDVIV